MTPITFTTGKEARDEIYAKQYIFWVPRTREAGQECYLGDAVSNPRSGITSLGTVSRVPAITGKNDLKGSWHTSQVSCPSGTVFKISGTRKMQRLALPKSGNLFVRVREDGPLHRIKFPTLQMNDSTLSHVEVVGRFDVLTIARVDELGIVIQPAFRRLSESPAVDIFVVELLEQELRKEASSRLVTATPSVLTATAGATPPAAAPAQFFRRARVRNFGHAPEQS